MINNKMDFVQALKRDGVYLRHHTAIVSWNKIKQDGYLKTNVTDINETVDPKYLPTLLANYASISAVYFQLVKSIVPRFEPQDPITELFFTPDVILSSDFVLHLLHILKM
jgi:hypothetical protein